MRRVCKARNRLRRVSVVSSWGLRPDAAGLGRADATLTIEPRERPYMSHSQFDESAQPSVAGKCSHAGATPSASPPMRRRSSSESARPLELVNLPPLMANTQGTAEVVIGLIDGPVALNHVDLSSNIRSVDDRPATAPSNTSNSACLHGTFVAGILCAKRGRSAPAICPDCTLLVRPVFLNSTSNPVETPGTTPDELAAAIVDCVKAGARVINLSLALEHTTPRGDKLLRSAFDYAATHGVIVVAAAGNQGLVGSSAITSHPAVVPVVSYDLRGRPIRHSNTAGTIGRRGLGAPGADVTSLAAMGGSLTLDGTSVATPFVSGAFALLLSAFRPVGWAAIKFALTRGHPNRRRSIVPPLMDASAAYEWLLASGAARVNA
jgi:subtilisin family serine protease